MSAGNKQWLETTKDHDDAHVSGIRSFSRLLPQTRCLFVESRESPCERLEQHLQELERAGALVTVVHGRDAPLKLLGDGGWELVIVRVPLAGDVGEELAQRAAAAEPPVATVVISGDLNGWTFGALTLVGAIVIHEQDLGDSLVPFAAAAVSRVARTRGTSRRPVLGERPDPINEFSERRGLTVRQRATLELLLAGASSKEMAEKLGIELSTVRRHAQDIYRKCDVQSTRELLSLFARKAIGRESV